MAFIVDGDQTFQTLDLKTGASKIIRYGVGAVYGLGELGSTVYGANGVANGVQIFSIDTSTGDETYLPVNPGTVSAYAMGSTQSGLYVLGTDNNIYRVNPITGVATMLGLSGVNLTSGWESLSDGGQNLYVVYNDSSSTEQLLGQVNTATGAVTPLGQVTTDNPSFDAMAYIGGHLYVGTGSNPAEVESLNISTLTATVVSSTPGVQGGFYGMVPLPTPEPAPLAAFGLGLIGIALRRKRR